MTTFRRNFLFGVIHEALWGMAFALINPMTILPLALKDLGGGAEQAGFMVALLWGGMNLPQLFSAFFFSPKWSDPKWLALMHAPAFVCVAALACLFYFFQDMDPGLKLGLFLALGGAVFVLLGVVIPHWINLITRAIPEKVRGRYFAWCFTVASLVGIGTGVLGASWCAAGGLRWGYAACFALALPLQIASVCVMMLQKPTKKRAEPSGPLKPFLKKQWAHATGNPEVAMFLAVFLLMQIASGSSGLYTVALKERGVPTNWFGLFNAALNGGALCGSFLMGHLADHKGARVGLIWGFLALGISVPFLIVPTLAPGWAVPAYLGGGFFGSAYPVINLYLLMKLAAPGQATQFSGAFATLTTPVLLFVPLFHGWLASHYSYAASFGVSIVACACGLLAIKLLPSFGAKTAVPPRMMAP